MCVSCVVPAFAAESEGCPAVHTKSNCEYTQIGEPHEAACGVQGYTTYQCNACKAYFADDFVNAAGSHAWQTVRQEPTCTEDGVYKRVCLNCGEEDELVSTPAKATGHDWEFKNGENCAEGMICKECGETSNEVGDEGHTWGKPELTVKPTHTTSQNKPGTAKFTCEVCGETKTVSVLHDGACSWKIDLTKYPSCEETGFFGGATCVICGKKVHLKKVDGCALTADCTVEGCDHTVAETNCVYNTASCAASGCTHYEQAFEHCDPATCTKTNCTDTICHKAADCTAANKDACVHVQAPYQEMAIINCKPSEEWVVTLPTCTAAGSAYKACTMCKKAVGTPVTLDPLGHNYQTKIYKEVTTGGLTAEQIAMFEALAENVAAGTSYRYAFYVEAEDGTLTTVTGSATVEAYVLANAQNLNLTVAPTTTGGSSSTTTPAPKTYVWTGEYKNVDPTDVDEAGNTYMHWGNNCSTETTSYRYACTVCGAEETPVSFIGHYWVQTDYQAPVCSTTALTAGYTEYTCANPNCDGLLEDRDEDDAEAGISYSVIADDPTTEENELRAVKRVSVAAGHVFTTVTVPVTCISVGYKYDVCTCGQIDYSKAAEGYGEEDTPANAIKGAYDIVAIDPSAHDVKEEVITPVTCTTDGKVHKYCGRVGCEYNAPVTDKYLETFVTVTATGHKKGDTYVDDTTDATCLKAKYRHYHCANNCGEFIDEVISPKKEHNYVLQTVEPDCTNKKGNNVLKCTNGCDQISTETVPATKFDKTNPNHHLFVEVRSVVKGDCTTLDKVMYYCPNCEEEWILEVDFVGTDKNGKIYEAGEGVGHDWEKQDAVKPTCAVDGQKEHYKCSVCDELAADENGETLLTEADVKIAKLSETGDHPKLADGTWDLTKVYYTEAVDATCTTAGHTAGLFCNECDSWISEEGTIKKYEHKYNSTYHEGKVNGASAFENVEGEYASGVASCTTWGYQLQECALCGEQQIVNYDAMWTEDGEHKLVANNDAEVPTCCTVGYTASQSCTVCDQLIVAREVIAKVPHVNKDGEEFYGICTDTVEDRECVVCKKGEFEYKYTDANGDEQTATIEINCDGDHDDDADTVNVPNFVVTYPEADAEKLAQGAHSWIVTEVEPTCMSYSYTLIVCEHCGYSFMTDEGATFSDEHAWGEWEITEASYTAEGKKVRECLLCDATEEVVIPKLVGIYAEIELDNAVAEGEILPDNGTVSLTVTTNASDLKVWGVRIELTYTGKIEQDADGKDVITVVSLSDKFGAEGLQVYHDPANKKITIVGTAPNGADGKLGEVTFDGEEELVQINLKLGKNSDGITVYTEKFEVNDKAQNYIEPMYDWSEEIYVGVMTGDVDGDYDVDINDAKALKKIITGESEEEYSSAADMNQDGEVTATDFAVMTNKLLGKKA